jgi:metal-dependent HD superfamily phosphatase/phosphodiesterase
MSLPHPAAKHERPGSASPRASQEARIVEATTPPGSVRASAGRRPSLPAYDSLVNDAEIRELIELSDNYLAVIGYTDHGIRHVGRVAMRAAKILHELGHSAELCDKVAVAGLLHDIGNVMHRSEHAQSSALMAFEILRRHRFNLRDIAVICGAIGNHDEGVGEPVSEISAALIIADKTDVLRSRVRNPRLVNFDIHDRVNFAATSSMLDVDAARRQITINLVVDTSISSVSEYFEIVLTRMNMSRRAAHYLNCDFRLVINDTIVM